jgi:hypothetical protein
VKLTDVEILACGVWNGHEFTREALDELVRSFDELGLRGRLPVTLGHGYRDDAPAEGWIASLRREGDVLIATFDDVSSELIAEIKAGRWRFCSVEVLSDVTKDDETYPWVLSGVAVLGSARPAVDGLAPLTAALSELSFAAHHCFTRELPRGGASEMTSEVDELRTQLRAQEQRLIALTFAAAIREGRCLPSAREGFTRRFKDAGTLADATQWISDAPRAPTRRAMTTAADANDNRALFGVRADHALVALTRRYLDENEVRHFTLTGTRLTFAEAAAAVTKDPANRGLVEDVVQIVAPD